MHICLFHFVLDYLLLCIGLEVPNRFILFICNQPATLGSHAPDQGGNVRCDAGDGHSAVLKDTKSVVGLCFYCYRLMAVSEVCGVKWDSNPCKCMFSQSGCNSMPFHDSNPLVCILLEMFL